MNDDNEQLDNEIKQEETYVLNAVTEDFILLTLSSVWLRSKLHILNDEQLTSFTMKPPVGYELIIAFKRNDKDIELPEGTISIEEFENMCKAQIDMEYNLFKYLQNKPTEEEKGDF